MKNTDVIDNLEVLDMRLEGLNSVLRLIAEANTNSEDGYNELNCRATEFLAETVEDLREKYVKTSISSLFESETEEE